MAIYAPYNFVPLANWVYIPEWYRQVSHDVPFQDGLSGEIAYTLIADSPLLVGGIQQKPSDDKQRPGEVHPFKLPDDRYAVPGSSLKGLLRAVIEIAAFGRMRMVDDARYSVRDLTPGARPFYGDLMTRTDNGAYEPKSRSGWLSYDASDKAWGIQPCGFARVEHDDLAAFSGDSWWKQVPREPEAKTKYERWASRPLDIEFDPGALMAHSHSNGKLRYRKAQNLGAGSMRGTLVFTGQPSARDPNRNGRKHREFVFFDPATNRLEIDERVWADFIHIHADSTEWKYWRGKGTKIPVFYLLDESEHVESLGLAMMYRLAYRHSIHQTLARTSPDHMQAPGIANGYDLADLLFGAVNGAEQSDALRGRVSCESALAEGAPKPSRQADTILNGPKPTYYPSYIRQENPQAGYRTFMDPDAELRGFKRYPARPVDMTQVQGLTQDQQKNRKVQVRLHTFPAGTRLSGRIVFHNLRPVELGAVVWALTWGANPNLRHGLGMGKPFGFGQVHFEIDTAASHILPNDPVLARYALDEAHCASFADCFVRQMESAFTGRIGAGGWLGSLQIVNLLAMADPDAVGQLPTDMPLRHMVLDNHTNEFRDGKRERHVLPDYAVATGRLRPGTSPRPGPAAASGNAGGAALTNAWVRETVNALMTAHHAPENDVLRGKPLAEQWAALTETSVKTAALECIKAIWQDKGWWGANLTGSAKRAKAIYDSAP